MSSPLRLKDYAPGGASATLPSSPSAPLADYRPPAAMEQFRTSFNPPGTPPAPGASTQAEGARRWPYRAGTNISLQPRASEGLTPFSWLINIADLYDVARIAIRYRIEEMAGLDWSIIPLDQKKPPSDAQLSEARGRLERPDGDLRWPEWCSVLMEEILVTDAATIYPLRSRKGEILSLDLVDGSTIRPLMNARGRRPQAPAPAYQQVLYGKVFWEASSDDLIYAPKNRRTRSLYGRSPTEDVAMTINRHLRREMFDLSYYNASNIPQALVGTSPEMTPDQIQLFQEWFDDIVSAEDRRRSLTFIPAPNGRLGVYEFKQPINDPIVEEFLITLVCAAIGVQAQSLGFTTKANRSNSEGQENIELRRRVPYIRFLAGLVTDLLRMMGYPDCAMQFQGERPEEDKLSAAQEADLYVKNGTWSTEEVRAKQGLGESDAPRFVYTGTGPVALPSSVESIAAVKEATAQENADIGDEADATGVEGAVVQNPQAQAPAGAADEEEGDTGDEPNAQATRAAALRELRAWEKREGAGRRREFVTRSLAPRIADAVRTLLPDPPEGVGLPVWRRAVFAEARAMAQGGRSRLSRKGNEQSLKDWFINDSGIDWGESGSFAACQAEASKHMDDEAEVDGFCANVYHEATGEWPGKHGGKK